MFKGVKGERGISEQHNSRQTQEIDEIDSMHRIDETDICRRRTAQHEADAGDRRDRQTDRRDRRMR